MTVFQYLLMLVVEKKPTVPLMMIMNRPGQGPKSGLPAELEAIVRSDDNKFCVDCGAKGPRWASVNLGYAIRFLFLMDY
jgi:hypothetical protein